MSDTDKANILVVDDLAGNLLVMGSVLEELGQNVITARSGAEALRRVLDSDFAVILLDVNMPGMGGYETASLIRGRKRSAHTPIIFITAYADEMNTAQGYALGAVDYVLSPVVPEVLRTKVRVFVELYLMTQQVRRQADERVALATAQAARAAAEEATRRSKFLAEASKVLSGSLDLEATVRGLARQAVPVLADLGAVTLVGEPGRPWQTELAWSQPPDDSVCSASLTQFAAPHDELRAAVERVLGGGDAVVLDALALAYPPAGCNGSVAGAGPPIRSAVVLPLTARGHTLGALTLALSAPRRGAAGYDMELARDFAGRAAVALDNARLYREVQEADRRKNEFLAMLAHELRNPLAPIRNGVQILRALGGTDPRMGAVRDMMDRQLQHLVRLVDDLLDISRITGDKIRLQAEPLDLGEVVTRAVETSRALIDERGQHLSVTLPGEPLCLQGDAVRLAQVIGNLLNNAAKYTEEGGEVRVSAAREGDQAVLRVRDTGIGIPANMLSSVFDLFTQVDRSLDRSQGGLGVGLTLVRRLVKMHGGTVEAHSEGPGRGSEFVVRLPLWEKYKGQRTKDETAAAVGPSSFGLRTSRRVLVVDDNCDAAESLALFLGAAGHEVRVCHDGRSALAAADELRPDAVLLDIGLPGMDGYQVARRLRALPGMDRALLVALTGYGQEEDQRRAREAGFDHHFVKPADLETLTALLAVAPTPAGVL